MYNGEFVHTVVDLRIPGRGIPFEFKRTYRSRLSYNGVLGGGWDHSYNRRLIVPAAREKMQEEFGESPYPQAGSRDVILCNGFGRVDAYKYVAEGSPYQSPDGFYNVLVRNGDESYTLRDRYGDRIDFDRDGRMVRQSDRNGNALQFRYEDDRLTSVIDTMGRSVDLVYNDAGRLKRVVDFSGRELVYQYDAKGNLVAARTPVVSGTSTGNDFPNGKITRYTYDRPGEDSRGDVYPALRHNLSSIIDPKGQIYLRNRYGQDPRSLHFDRVVRQQEGTKEQIHLFQYRSLNAEAGKSNPNIARNVTGHTDRKGNVREYRHNYQGNLLKKTVYTNSDINPDDPNQFETEHRYDRNGMRVQTVFPELNEVHYTYDTMHSDSLQRGNLLRVEHLPGPRGGDQERRIISYTYEPIYNQVLSVTEERGHEPDFQAPNGGESSAERYTQRNLFDYQEGTSLTLLARERLEGASRVFELLEMAGIELNLGDLNGDGTVAKTAGNVVQKKAPSVRLPVLGEEIDASDPERQEVVSTYVYNRFGQLTREIDPEGNVDELLYHPESDPDGDGVPSEGVGLDQETGGYLFATVQDAAESDRRASDSPLLKIRTERYYDLVGNPIRTVDARGNDTLVEINALNQIVRVESEAPFRYYRELYYDANDNVVREEVQNALTNGPGLADSVATLFEYDILDSKVSESREVSGSESLRTEYEYDLNQNLEVVRQPEGNVVRMIYDERDLVYQTTRGVGSDDRSHESLTYDGNGNLIRRVDGEDNNGDQAPEEFQFEFDGYDRLIGELDPVGNGVRNSYDPRGHLISRKQWGRPGGASPKTRDTTENVLLSETVYHFDELGRQYQVNERLFSNGTEVGPDGDASPGDGWVTTTTIFDALGRVSRVIDDNLNAVTQTYDGADRLVSLMDALGNETLFEYDANHNRVGMIETERSPEGLVSPEVFETRFEYDSLDRLIATIDNMGNRTSLAYDSRNNVVGQTDPMGNLTVSVFDGQNRKLEEHRLLSVGGAGGDTLEVDNPTNPDGRVSFYQRWDQNSRVLSVTDDNGNVTRYEYDDLNRLVVERFADGTTRRSVYDRDDNLIRTTDQNGTVAHLTYDGLNRLVAKRFDRASGVVSELGLDAEGVTEQRFEYDGLSRQTLATDNNDPTIETDDSIVRFFYDSLSRVLVEEQQLGQQSIRRVSSVYDGVGRRLSCTYPSGRILEMGHDALNRTVSIRNQLEDSSIVEYDYLGPSRVLERRYGNGTVTRFHDGQGMVTGYDALRRETQREAIDGRGHRFSAYRYLYDRVGNRRLEQDLVSEQTDLYQYDADYRLTSVAYRVPNPVVDSAALGNNLTVNETIESLLTQGDTIERWSLDGVGNWNSVARGESVTAFVANEMNEYAQVGDEVPLYDDNGNLGLRQGTILVHDSLNRLIALRNQAGETVANYQYDALGRRISKTTSAGLVEHYLYDEHHCIEERGAADALVHQYVYGVRLDEAVELRTGEGESLYYLHNSLGSIVALADSGGSVIERYGYDAYGAMSLESGDGNTRANSQVGNPLGFTGRRFDVESGLWFHRARYLDPVQGRFVQRDSMGYVDGFGLYTYVGNNPINFLDPFGLEKILGQSGSLWAFGSGFLYGGQQAVVGVYQVVTNPRETLEGFWNAVQNWDQTEVAIRNQLLSTGQRLRDGNAHTWGQVTFEVGSFFVGVGVVSKAGKVSTLGRLKNWLPKGKPKASATQWLYRGDSRASSKIFNNGFRAKGTNQSLLEHTLGDPKGGSAYVSTSKSYEVAASHGGGNRVYVVRGKNAIDVNKTLGTDPKAPISRKSPHPHEHEVAIPKAIDPSDIRAVTIPEKGVSILNPNWKP